MFRSPGKSKLKRLSGRRETRCLMVGLDSSGKTTLLYKLKLGEIVTTIPTIGFNVETVDTQRGSFTIWDVGGNSRIRALWRHYLQNTQVLLFCVDSADPSRFAEAKGELDRLLTESELQEARLVVVAAKQDLPQAQAPAAVATALGLASTTDREWVCVGSSSSDPSEVLDALTCTRSTPSGPKPEPAEDGGGELKAQHLMWRAYVYAHDKLGVNYDTSLAPASFGGTPVPGEIVSLIMDFLPLRDLLPCGDLHPKYRTVYPQGAWLVCHTFAACALNAACQRIGRRWVDEEHPKQRKRAGVDMDEADAEFDGHEQFTAILSTRLPPSLQPLQALTAALLTLVVVSGPSAEGCALRLLRPSDQRFVDLVGASTPIHVVPALIGYLMASVSVLTNAVENDADAAAPDPMDATGAELHLQTEDLDVMKLFIPTGSKNEVALSVVLPRIARVMGHICQGISEYLLTEAILRRCAPDFAVDADVPRVNVLSLKTDGAGILGEVPPQATAIRSQNYCFLSADESCGTPLNNADFEAVLDVIRGCESPVDVRRVRGVHFEGLAESFPKVVSAVIDANHQRGTLPPTVQEVHFQMPSKETLTKMVGTESGPLKFGEILVQNDVMWGITGNVVKMLIVTA